MKHPVRIFRHKQVSKTDCFFGGNNKLIYWVL